MKIVIIGDIHGHDSWKDIVKKEEADKIIFLGDYFDCYDKISPEEQLNNFNEICKLKNKRREGEVIILLGNHDFENYTSFGCMCSGFNPKTKKLIGSTLDTLIAHKIVLPLYIYDDIIFSHAGVSNTWLNKIYKASIVDLEGGFDLEKLRTLTFNFYAGYNGYGDTVSQSPLWIRPTSLSTDRVESYTQVVGHTGTENIKEGEGIWFCDTLPREYLIIENNKFIIKKCIQKF